MRTRQIATQFTTVHHSILLDKRLSPTAFRVLLCILMDADDFRLSQTLLVNRLGMEKKTIQLALNKLEECGYLRRTPLKRGSYYTISEYGNIAEKDGEVAPTSEAMVAHESQTTDESPILETATGRSITQEEAHFILDYLTESGHDRYFEKILNALNEGLSNGSIAIINEAAILGKLPKQPTTKTKLPTNLGQIRQLYKIPELFDMILPVVQLRSGGNMITQKSKEDIVLRTMRKFADAEDGLSENKVVNFILTIKGEYTNSGSLDQRYQN